METSEFKMHRTYWVIIIFIGLAGLAYGFTKYYPTRFDDAYIFIRYAKNIINGHDVSWNSTDGPVYGFTSTAYLIWITFLRYILPFNDSIILQMGSVLMGILYLVFLIDTILFLIPADKSHQQYSFLIVFCFLLIFGRGLIYHLYSGMDTTMSMLANMLIIRQLIKVQYPIKTKALIWIILASFFSYWSRPDNIFYAFLVPLLWFLFQNYAQRFRTIIWMLLGLTAMIFSDLIIKFWYFGDWLPLSFYVKQNGFYGGYADHHLWNPVTYILNILTVNAPFIILVILFVTKRTFLHIAAFILPTILTFLSLHHSVQIMGMESRFYYPSTPFIVIAGVYVLMSQAKISDVFEKLINHIQSPIRILALYAVFILVANNLVLSSKYEQQLSQKDVVYENPILYDVQFNSLVNKNDWFSDILYTSMIVDDLPSGSTIACTEIGLIGSKKQDIKAELKVEQFNFLDSLKNKI